LGETLIDLRLGDCLEVLPTLMGIDAVVTDPPYGTGERLRIEGEFVNSRQEWDVWDLEWLKFIEGLPVAFFCPPQRIIDGLHFANRLLAWVSANPIAKKDVSPRYGIQHILARGPFPVHYGLDWFKHRSNIQTIEHPHQKPLPVMRWLVETMSKPGDTILDPFMGSGSTGVACKQIGRNFIGIEREPKYFAIAEKRIAEAQQQMVMAL
jgi:site-specific DNA-methyltransferase (adenine-specific)